MMGVIISLTQLHHSQEVRQGAQEQEQSETVQGSGSPGVELLLVDSESRSRILVVESKSRPRLLVVESESRPRLFSS